jgi:dUTPase
VSAGIQVQILEPRWRCFDAALGREVDLTPFFDHEGDSGRRLYVLEETVLVPFVPTLVPHGLAARPRTGHAFDIRPRSGSLLKKNIQVTLGTIDEGYGGQLMTVATYMPVPERVTDGLVADACTALLNRHLSHDYEEMRALSHLLEAFGVVRCDMTHLVLKRGERISQLVEVALNTDVGFELVPQLVPTSRGSAGFNSTSESTFSKEAPRG